MENNLCIPVLSPKISSAAGVPEHLERATTRGGAEKTSNHGHKIQPFSFQVSKQHALVEARDRWLLMSLAYPGWFLARRVCHWGMRRIWCHQSKRATQTITAAPILRNKHTHSQFLSTLCELLDHFYHIYIYIYDICIIFQSYISNTFVQKSHYPTTIEHS